MGQEKNPHQVCITLISGASLAAQMVFPACNAGDLGLIPGSERSPGEGNSNTLQYSCLGNPMDCSPPSFLSVGFSKQEYWSRLTFPSPGDLSDPGMEPGSPMLWADYLPSEPPGKLLLLRSTSSRARGLQ